MDPRRALMLQVEWGADEALDVAPRARLRPSRPAVASPPADLASLAAALAASDGAGLAATATSLVLPTGRPDGLLVVGEAPGTEEDRSGRAFVGPAGLLLRRMLASIGIEAEQAMLAYLAPWRPPGGRAPNEGEIAVCLPLLHQLIALSRPRLVLALGSVPAKALLGSTMRRGRWGEVVVANLDHGVPVLPTANPAVLSRQRQQKAAAWADLRMLRRRMDVM